jgi:hypothetical protein
MTQWVKRNGLKLILRRIAKPAVAANRHWRRSA